MTKTLAMILVMATVSPVFAQSRPDPTSNARFGALRKAGPAYRALFQPNTPNQPIAAIQPLKPSASPASKAKSTVVCGMTLIPADPSLDPKMVAPRFSDGIDHKIRAIDPPICKP